MRSGGRPGSAEPASERTGVMASSKGNATDAPRPLRTVLREILLRLLIGLPPDFVGFRNGSLSTTASTSAENR